jgi:hypothetical protein
MTTATQVIQHRSFNIEVLFDQDFNFCRDFGTAGVMVCWHKKYRLGHVQPKGSPEEFMREKLIDWYHTYLTSNRKFKAQDYHDYCCTVEDMNMAELTVEFEKHHVSVPLFFLDHSSQHIKAGSKGSGWDSWDSGCVGFMYMTQDQVFDHFGFNAKRLNKKLREEAIQHMITEVEDYNTYLQQEVYRYRIMDGDEVWYEGEGGWFGDDGIKELTQEAMWKIDKPKCDQCKLTQASTGGVTVIFHEDGCPNDDREWNPDDQSWHDVESLHIDDEE